MNQVVSLAEVLGDNRMQTPEQSLEKALADLRSGDRVFSKVLILTLDDDGSYDNGYYAANLHSSEMMALCFHTAQEISRDLSE